MRARPNSLTLWASRLGWLGLIWLASVLSLGAVAFAFRSLMTLAGMHP